jgi:two-component system cell cycle sensor histidine kinase/response regulator CckA
VLVVEDEPIVRRLLAEMLSGAGCEVRTAATPKEALEQAATCEIDVLVTDVVMPEMNGRELAQAIVAQCPHVLVLYMSGYSADAVLHRGVIESEDPFLQKPFTAEQLQHALRQLIAGRSA